MVIVKGGAGGTYNSPPQQGDIWINGKLYTPEHPDYEKVKQEAKEIIMKNFGTK